MGYPNVRMRRLRSARWVRDLVAESNLSSADLVLPVFVCEGTGVEDKIEKMPGVMRYSCDRLVELAKGARDAGIKMLALFPVIEDFQKDERGSLAIDPENILCKAIARLKREVPGIGLMADVALDPYTTHGHDGIVVCGDVDNDVTNSVLVEQAIVLASVGCDVVAPSDMMDGRVGAIRFALESGKFVNTIIAAYGAKYASSFYGPYRDAVKSGRECYLDKKTYQMDYRNGAEALSECMLDEMEGADMLIIKPGIVCLDIISKVSAASRLPVLAYQVSGEYAMLRNAGEMGLFDYRAAMLECLIAMKRAGARGIICYDALGLSEILAA